MPVFKYKAASNNGKTRKGIVDAASRSQAVQKLRDEGLYPIDITKARSSSTVSDAPSGLRRPITFGSGVSRDAVAATIRQLATLLQADLPLDKALDAVIKGGGRQTELKRILTEVREAIREGSDLATAFAKYPKVFSETFVTMIQAGENSGTLGVVMERLADHIEQQLALRRKIQASLAYPMFTLLVGVCVVIFLLAFVVPKVTEIFVGMDRALPVPTQILLSISDIARNWWSAALIILTLFGYGCYRYYKTTRGKTFFDTLLLKTPVLGDIVGQLAVGRFTETLGMLLKNGTTLVTSLDIVKNVVGNTVMKGVVKQIHHDVQEGKPLTGPMEKCSTFGHSTIQMISAGEQSGHLETMLLVVAKDCENKINTKLQVLTSLLEPLMILILGGLVGFVVMAVLLPIFEMSNLISG